MLRFIICGLLVNLSNFSTSQEVDMPQRQQEIAEMRVDRHFHRKYKYQLDLLRRTYPMALKAKELIDEYEKDMKNLSKKRKKKKYGANAHDELKDNFVYNIRDLYRSEGDLLMKLVHRETGMTVNEIIKKYRGGFQTSVYSGMAKIWGHDLNDTYDANGDNWITEIVIQDILSGRIEFDTTLHQMDKIAFKSSMKEYRSDRKDYRKETRKNKKK